MDPSRDGGGGLTATGVFCGSCGAQSSPTAKFCGESTTRPDEARIEHFQARTNTAHYGNDGNLIDDPQSGSETGRSRGLVTVSDAPRAIRSSA